MLAVLAVFHVVCFGWLFFCAGSFGTVLLYLRSLVAMHGGIAKATPWTIGLLVLGLALHVIPRDLTGRIGRTMTVRRLPDCVHRVSQHERAVLGLRPARDDAGSQRDAEVHFGPGHRRSAGTLRVGRSSSHGEAGSHCLAYEPAVATITGTIGMATGYGPPGFGKDPKTDPKFQYARLRLDHPSA